MSANNVRLTFNKRDIQNLITVINWGLSDYEEEDHIKELETLLAKLEKARSKFYD